jgi:hypothetical protein
VPQLALPRCEPARLDVRGTNRPIDRTFADKLPGSIFEVARRAPGAYCPRTKILELSPQGCRLKCAAVITIESAAFLK